MNLNSKAMVTTDDKGENFLLYVPFHLNGLAQKAPSRRFMKSKKAWFLRGFRMNAEYIESQAGRIIIDDKAKALIKNIQKKSEVKITPFPLSYSFRPDMPPMQKQMEALNMAWGKKVFCFSMEMGTGKSKIYTDLGSAMFQQGIIDAMVIMTKVSLCDNIQNEVRKHTPLEVYDVFKPDLSTEAKRKKAYTLIEKSGNMRFVAVGIESLSQRLGGGYLFEWLVKFLSANRCAMVVDESHLIKNPESNRTKNVISLGRLAEYRYIGTGTMVLNSILDLYSQYEFLDPDIIGIGDYHSFKNRYTIRGGYKNKEVIGYDNIEELTASISPWTIQISKEEMMDLPPKVYMDPVRLDMTKEQRKIYDSLKKEKLAEVLAVGGPTTIVLENILAVYLALQQVCSGFISHGEKKNRIFTRITDPTKDPKQIFLMDMVSEYDKKQFNIWTRHLLELHATYDNLKAANISAVKIFGGMSQTERTRARELFTSKQSRCMVSTQEVGGTGFTFTNCSDVIYLSNSFSFGDRVQSEDRNHRKGTTQKVTYTDVIMKDSVEELVLSALKEKKDLATYVKEKLSDIPSKASSFRDMVMDMV